MSYKPDESILISYLYGELEEKEKAKVERYLQENPDERKNLLEMATVSDIMGSLKDKEVITPPVFVEDQSGIVSLWSSPYIKTIASIAASFLLLMMVGRLIGMDIQYGQGELRIGFGTTRKETTETMAVVTPLQVQEMINSTLSKNNEVLTANWTGQQRKTDQSIRQGLDLNSKKIDAVVKNASLASQDQLRTFVAGLQQDNLRLMKDYLQLSSTEQKKYVENLLVDFSKYLQEQRNQDLNLFQTRMYSIEKNSDQFKQETEQILASIISTGVPKNKNSY